MIHKKGAANHPRRPSRPVRPCAQRLQTRGGDHLVGADELLSRLPHRLAARHLVLFITLQDPGLQATVDAPPDSLADMARSAIADDFLNLP